MTTTATRTRPGTSYRGWSAPLLLLVGIVVIPGALGILFNSWDAPDDAAYIRMAFATVAGATMAIATTLGLLLDRILRRASVSTIAVFAGIALVVCSWEVGVIAGAADLLLVRLNLPQ